MPKITITIDDIDSREYPDDCADKPWSAWIEVTSDDGRVSDFADAGLGATVREAIEDAVQSIPSDDDGAWLKRSWPNGDRFVVVEGGLVQNSPELPVFDLDVLTTDFFSEDDLVYTVDLYGRMKEAGRVDPGVGDWIAPVEELLRDKLPTEELEALGIEPES